MEREAKTKKAQIHKQEYRKQLQKSESKKAMNKPGQRATTTKLFSFLLILYLCLVLACASSSHVGECLGEQQRQIFSSLPACQARPALVDLRPVFHNHSQVMQVIPDHVAVDRCGGSCYGPAHTCSPMMKSVTMVQVMLVLSKWPHGEHETLCTEVEVEVHDQCECGCRIQPDQCLPGLQYYHQPSCRCICSDSSARYSCLRRGSVWDPDSCQCKCPAHSWQHCSTGYMFDYVSTCSCVQISSTASKSVLAAIFIVMASIMVFVVGGFLMFRYKRGLFKEEPLLNKVGQEQSSAQRKRSIFMSQISRSEFDTMHMRAKLGTEELLTIFEFDKKRSSVQSQDTVEEDI